MQQQFSRHWTKQSESQRWEIYEMDPTVNHNNQVVAAEQAVQTTLLLEDVVQSLGKSWCAAICKTVLEKECFSEYLWILMWENYLLGLYLDSSSKHVVIES